MSNLNYAIFIDLENAGGKVHTLNTIIDKVKVRGNILLGRAYGYTDSFSPLKEILLSNTFQVVPSLKFGHSQKNNLDIQLVIDALEVAYKNELIDCFCIVSGDSDYTPLVGKLKSMGKFVLGISRSEVAGQVFINACNEFVFLESMAAVPLPEQQKKREGDNGDMGELNRLVCAILSEREDCIYASELKSTIMRLKPDFTERDYGANTFGKLLKTIEKKHKTIRLQSDNFALKVSLTDTTGGKSFKLTPENWLESVRIQLEALKADGFERVNPSVIKQTLLDKFQDFDERELGFKKFSDLIRCLEKHNVVHMETDDQKTMLVRIL